MVSPRRLHHQEAVRDWANPHAMIERTPSKGSPDAMPSYGALAGQMRSGRWRQVGNEGDRDDREPIEDTGHMKSDDEATIQGDAAAAEGEMDGENMQGCLERPHRQYDDGGDSCRADWSEHEYDGDHSDDEDEFECDGAEPGCTKDDGDDNGDDDGRDSDGDRHHPRRGSLRCLVKGRGGNAKAGESYTTSTSSTSSPASLLDDSDTSTPFSP
jgi:hypothetical protein